MSVFRSSSIYAIWCWAIVWHSSLPSSLFSCLSENAVLVMLASLDITCSVIRISFLSWTEIFCRILIRISWNNCTLHILCLASDFSAQYMSYPKSLKLETAL